MINTKGPREEGMGTGAVTGNIVMPLTGEHPEVVVILSRNC